MSFLPLTPGIGSSPDTGAEGGRRKPPSKADIEKALRRDQNTCRFCGFQSTRYQRVIPWINEKNKDELVTICTFCEPVVNLERGGPAGSIFLIWLPEITQADLNHLLRALYVARGANGPLAAQATKALDALVARRAEAKKRLGSDDPLLLAAVFQENLSLKERVAATAKLDGIRVLPPDKWYVRGPKGETDRFPDLLAYWQSTDGPFARLPVEKWTDLFAAATAAVGHA